MIFLPPEIELVKSLVHQKYKVICETERKSCPHLEKCNGDPLCKGILKTMEKGGRLKKEEKDIIKFWIWDIPWDNIQCIPNGGKQCRNFKDGACEKKYACEGLLIKLGIQKPPEAKYYEPIKKKLEQFLEGKLECDFEITANKFLSRDLQDKIWPDRKLPALGREVPDITGYTSKEDVIIIEIKREIIKLDDIYQARKYAELFNSKYGFLISTEKLPSKIKQLSNVVDSLLSLPKGGKLNICRYKTSSKSLTEWYPDEPFK